MSDDEVDDELDNLPWDEHEQLELDFGEESDDD